MCATDIYPAGEPAIPGITRGAGIEKIKDNFPDKPVEFVPKEQLSRRILEIIKPGDTLVMLGAGDIIKASDVVVEELKKNR